MLTLTGKLWLLQEYLGFNVKCLQKANAKDTFQKNSPLFFQYYLFLLLCSVMTIRKKKKVKMKQKLLTKTPVKSCWIKMSDVLISWMNLTMLFWKQGKHSWSSSTEIFWSFRSDYHQRLSKGFTYPEISAGTMQKSITLHEVVTSGCHVHSEYQQMPPHPVGTQNT